MAQLGRSDYFAAGMKLLADHGPAGLTTVNICEQLQITRGSFYHHFPSAPAFHAALIAHWESDVYARAQEIEAQHDFSAQLELFEAQRAKTHHKAERAIRIWAFDNPMVDGAQRRVDAFRRASLVTAYLNAGVDEADAQALALVGVALQTGTQMLQGLSRQEAGVIVDAHRKWREASIRALTA